MTYYTFNMVLDPALYGFSFNGEPQEIEVTYSIMCPGPDPKVYVQKLGIWPPLLAELKNPQQITRMAYDAAKHNAVYEQGIVN